MTNSKFIKYGILTLAIVTMASVYCEEEEKKSGFGLAPGLNSSANVPLGKEIELPEFFEIHNYGKKKRSLFLKISAPQNSGITGWEKGYEAVPDISWFKLEKEEIEIDPTSVMKIKATIKIPKQQELYNRKFMVTVTCEAKQENNKSSGLNLRMVSRWMVETETSDEAKPVGGNSISFAPSIVRLSGKPGESLNKSVAVVAKSDLDLQPLDFKSVEPDAEKHDRYFGAGRVPLINESWLSPIEKIKLTANEAKTINVMVKIPTSAKAGQIYEELIFFKYNDKYDFLRVRTAVSDGK